MKRLLMMGVLGIGMAGLALAGGGNTQGQNQNGNSQGNTVHEPAQFASELALLSGTVLIARARRKKQS